MTTNAELNAKVRESEERVEALAETVDSVVESLEKLDGALVEQEKRLDSKLDSILSAINVAPRKIFEPAEHDPNEYSSFEPTEIDDEAVIVQSRLMDVDSPEFKTKAAIEAFMREPVKIFIHQTSEKNADQVFDVSVNGRALTLQRGQERVVPRMYVDCLARAKPIHYENEEYTQANGTRAIRHPGRRGLRYGFSVIEDRNPIGAAWLKKVLAEA